MWALEWYSKNRIDGEKKHLVHYLGLVKLFRTREKAREYRDERFGYIRNRPDLRKEPHGWRLPQPVKVKVIKV